MQEDDNNGAKFGEAAFSVEQLFGESWRDDLANLLATGGEESYDSESRVIAAATPPEKVYFLKNGRVQMIASDGSTNIFEACPVCSPKVFGLVDVLSGTKSADDIRAATHCVFDVIKADDIKRFLGQRPELCFRLTRAVSSLCRSSVKRLVNV
jgi:CRP-like cAMP-binding protein